MLDQQDDEADTISLALRCQWCSKDVVLTYQPGGIYRTSAWSCPYWACQKIQKIDLQGSIVRVVAR